MRNLLLWRLLAVVWSCAPFLAGCRWITPAPAGKPLLTPLTLATDAADLEVVLFRVPAGDSELGDTLWNQVDEQGFSADLRRELSANGLRAGLIGGQLPEVLSRRLSAGEDPTSPAATAAKMQGEAPVRRSRMQLHRGRPGKIVTSGIYDQISLLTLDDGQLHGKTYPKAQGLLVVQVDPQADGRVRLSLTPNLEYGEPRQQWVGDDGMFRLESGRPKQVFERLKTDIVLAPNQTLLLSSIPQRSGSLGHYLFTEPGSGRVEQKLLMIRLAKSKFDDLFAQAVAPAEPKPGNPPADGQKPTAIPVSVK
ncbi:MAG TPA: hypothetical protein VHX65_15265 [Pirellulales bacterium]|jgi:hypothetical protein|nr:hypothetical protein [Pirellulales bacterium]